MATYEEVMAKARELAAAGRMDDARRAAQIAIKMRGPAQPAAQTSIPAQAGYGLASGANAGFAEAIAGKKIDYEEVAGPDGRVQYRSTGLSPRETVFSDAVENFPPPQTAGQTYARRAGEEVGYGLPLGAAGSIGQGARGMIATLGLNAGMDATSAVAGQASGDASRGLGAGEDIARGADIIASMLTGAGAATALSKATKTRPPSPTMEDNFRIGGRELDFARNSGVELTPQARGRYETGLLDTVVDQNAGSVPLYPNTHATLDEISGGQSKTIGNIIDDRRLIGRKVAAKPDEASVGAALKKQTEDFLEGLTPADTVGGVDPTAAVESFQSGNRKIAQGHKAKSVMGGETRAESSAATAGRGGNATNRMRQNVRKIWDNEVAPTKPGKRSGYTPDEIAQMEKIVFGEGAQNILRHLAGMAPTTGALPMMGAVTGAAGSAIAASALQNPWFLLGAAPPAVGYIAKGMSERSTRRQIAELLDIINRGGSQVLKETPDSVKRAIAAQLVGRAAQADRQ